jgi:hypothetical protein
MIYFNLDSQAEKEVSVQEFQTCYNKKGLFEPFSTNQLFPNSKHKWFSFHQSIISEIKAQMIQ